MNENDGCGWRYRAALVLRAQNALFNFLLRERCPAAQPETAVCLLSIPKQLDGGIRLQRVDPNHHRCCTLEEFGRLVEFIGKESGVTSSQAQIKKSWRRNHNKDRRKTTTPNLLLKKSWNHRLLLLE